MAVEFFTSLMVKVECETQEFIDQLRNVNNGASMLFGSTLDSIRASSILKNLRTIHIRKKQHLFNVNYSAERFEKDGLKTVYPALKYHKSKGLFTDMINKEY